MTVAVIGLGVMGRTHLAAWRSLGIEARPVGRADVEEALATCSIVDICTPTPAHLDLTVRAAAAGCQVICEKPLALTTRDAEAMVASCETAGVGLLPAHVVRWFPDYVEAERVVRTGQLGELRQLRFDRHAPAPIWAEWFGVPEQSGGMITDLLIHDLDAARWLAGDVAELSASLGPNGDSASIRLVHTSRAISVIKGSWGAPELPLSSPFSISGSAGRIAGSGQTGGRDPYADQLGELYRALTEGTPARVTAADGVAAVRLAELARAAAG